MRRLRNTACLQLFVLTACYRQRPCTLSRNRNNSCSFLGNVNTKANGSLRQRPCICMDTAELLQQHCELIWVIRITYSGDIILSVACARLTSAHLLTKSNTMDLGVVLYTVCLSTSEVINSRLLVVTTVLPRIQSRNSAHVQYQSAHI